MEKDNEVAIANAREPLRKMQQRESPKLLVLKLTEYNDGLWSSGLMAGIVILHEGDEKSLLKISVYS